jgi:hypothetical protein
MKLIILGIIAVIIVGYTAFTMFGGGKNTAIFATPNKLETVQAEPMRKAKALYKQKKSEKVDFDQSPCLSEDMGDGYALDIVHNPRMLIDDQNKCQSYEETTVKHLVEMNPEGAILSVR